MKLDEYSDDFLIEILTSVKTIALVGASSNPERDSFKVMKVLLDNGYKVFPVNPNEKDNIILGQSCYCLLYTSPSPRDPIGSRMPSSA